MATVFRVKRRSEEEPHQALVLTYKKRKANDGGVAEDVNPPTVVKLAATAKSQEEDVGRLIPTVIEEKESWKSLLQHKVDVSKKIRSQRELSSKNARFKVVNCFRHIENTANVEESENNKQREVVVVDIESEENKQDKEMTKVEDDHYVYDIYYSQGIDYHTIDLDIVPYMEEVDMGFRLVQSNEEVEDLCEDESDDSNSESNWRNEYPDTDDSIDEDDMRLAMQMGKVRLDSETNELSSDEDLIYGMEADPFDVEHYGEKYAKYKARLQRELSEDELSESDKDSSCRSAEDDDEEDPVSRFL